MNNTSQSSIDIYVQRYFKIDATGVDPDTFAYNLRLIFKYLDEHSESPNSREYGSASRMIKRKCQKMYGKRYLFSKREIRSLCYLRGSWLRIPYRLDYIFRAIFTLVQELQQQGYPLPSELNQLIGQVRRNCFYSTQSSMYRTEYDNIPEADRPDKTQNLYEDMFGSGHALGQKF